ncbi:ThiF family adenylyltransferase [Streptomyces sp. A7024]|uniref:ThiF family adenylyltransferase n=1 Tax=Streptomyces coryli TaxID=1128680 RepID=A0A6G4U9X9_9ACTN|nr:ThiF family adenylyltransferase [Streptomyces coryli]NGN67991.1 ThiF family adenylyltransferase [Streptomyces coryli]
MSTSRTSRTTVTTRRALGPDAYYAALTERNRGLIPAATQQALRAATVLVAGCGSTGGAVIEPLARLGVGGFVLAEPGAYELNNLNRQHAGRADIGRNKARAAADRITDINPYATVRIVTDGVLPGNAAGLAAAADVIVDGVDVTTRAGWHAKYALHAAGAYARRPVVSGYDLSGTQHIRHYDYGAGLRPLAGAVREADLAHGELWELLLRIIPRAIVPADLVADIRAHGAEPDYSVPQLVYASELFGVLAARYVAEIVAGHPVRPELTVDVHQLVAPSVAP